MEKIVSSALLLPALGLCVGAWLVWVLHDARGTIASARWRRIAITIGLLSIAGDVALSLGYLLYSVLAQMPRWSVFDNCSTAGGIACLVATLGAFAGKGGATRVLVALGGLGGMFFWYLTIGPRT